MTAIVYLHRIVIPAALDLLPERMDTPRAEAMMLAIALQESRAVYRRQIRGPARSLFQFEVTGVIGVMAHPATRECIREVLKTMAYPADPMTVHDAMEHNDILAAVFARLLLWTHAMPLPVTAEEAWAYYLNLWRPGKPHKTTWDAFWKEAENVVRTA